MSFVVVVWHSRQSEIFQMTALTAAEFPSKSINAYIYYIYFCERSKNDRIHANPSRDSRDGTCAQPRSPLLEFSKRTSCKERTVSREDYNRITSKDLHSRGIQLNSRPRNRHRDEKLNGFLYSD